MERNMYTQSDAQTDSYAPRIDLQWREPSGPQWKLTRDEQHVQNGFNMFLFYFHTLKRKHTQSVTPCQGF